VAGEERGGKYEGMTVQNSLPVHVDAKVIPRKLLWVYFRQGVAVNSLNYSNLLTTELIQEVRVENIYGQ
jgi:hypothetical protein